MTETFTAGEEATYAVTGRPVRVAFGPYKGMFTDDEDLYLVTFLDGDNQGRSAGVRVSKLERKSQFKEGDAVLAEFLEGAFTVAAGPFKSDSGPDFYVLRDENGAHVPSLRTSLSMAPPANTFTHDGVTYDLTAVYLDAGEERWEFTGRYSDDGIPLTTLVERDDPLYKNRRLSSVARCYGPLRKA